MLVTGGKNCGSHFKETNYPEENGRYAESLPT